MQAVILAAGKSSRFQPFSFLGHKSLFPLFGKPLLQHTLEACRQADISNVVIVVGEGSSIPESIQPISGLKVTFVTQKEKLGMGNALSTAEPYLEENFFLLSGYHVDFADFADRMTQKQKKTKCVVLLAKEDTILEKYGVIEVHDDKVVSLIEKEHPNPEKKLRLVSIYLLTKSFFSVLNTIPTEEYHFEKALDLYAKSHDVQYILATTPAVTCKNTWDLFTIKDYLLSKKKMVISPKASIAKSAVIEKNVTVEDGAKILEGACVKGPCYIGKNAIVGTNAILRNGVIVEENVVVGATMEVKNSILMQNVTTHTGFIGDSIVGPDSRLAAGFCSANVRFDRGEITAKVKEEVINTHRVHFGAVLGSSVDTGVNVVTMPGISVGNNVTVGPGTIVMENVDDNTLLYTKFQTVVKKKR